MVADSVDEDESDEDEYDEELEERYLVFGYVREVTKAPAVSKDIPSEIVCVILEFFATPSPLILMHGSGNLKSGFVGDDAPYSVIPSIIGRPRQESPVAELHT